MAYPPISTLPEPPSRQDPANFADEADAFLGALPTFQSELNTAGTYIESVGADVDAGVILSEEWASKTNGIVDTTDYSSKAWAVGGTGVTDTASAGAAKEWAVKAEDSTVDGTSYSALHHAAKAAASASAAAASATAASLEASAWSSGASYSVGDVVYSPIDYQTYRAITTHSGVTTDPSEDETNWISISSGGGGLTSQTATTTTTSETSIATYATADYTALELTVVADDGTDRTITKLLVVHNGTTASATQYGEVNTNTALATYDVDIDSGNVRLLATPASTASTDFTTKENLFEPV